MGAIMNKISDIVLGGSSELNEEFYVSAGFDDISANCYQDDTPSNIYSLLNYGN